MEQRHELRLGEFSVVVRANALDDGRSIPGVDIGQKQSKAVGTSYFRFKKYAISSASSR